MPTELRFEHQDARARPGPRRPAAAPASPRRRCAALALCLGLAWTGITLTPLRAAAETAAETPTATAADTRALSGWASAEQMANWVLASGDNKGLPFAVIDKITAELFVFSPGGELLGGAPVLLGFARGDDAVPGIGDRELSDISPEERTTPAGRFLAAYGPAAGTKAKVLWVDFRTAISLHPVVTSNRKEQRPARLKSPTPEDNRITFGCINVSAAFYREVVRKTFMPAGGVFYVLPDTKSVAEAFPALPLQVASAMQLEAALNIESAHANAAETTDALSGGGDDAVLAR